MDFAWWEMYHAEVARTFKGQKHSTCGACTKFGIQLVQIDGKVFNPHRTSGAGAVMLAYLSGARRVIMLGYDCQHTGGKAHWHGDHPAKLGNANRPESWIKGFERAAKEVSGIEVINCSRATALDMFPRKELGECLEVAE
jgi:hypothetical protein